MSGIKAPTMMGFLEGMFIGGIFPFLASAITMRAVVVPDTVGDPFGFSDEYID